MVKMPPQYKREELECFETIRLLNLKNRWSQFMKEDENASLKKEGRHVLAMIRDIINGREDEKC